MFACFVVLVSRARAKCKPLYKPFTFKPKKAEAFRSKRLFSSFDCKRCFTIHSQRQKVYEYTSKLGISTPDFICKWHGVEGRPIAKVLKHDLIVVKEFGPNIIILQLRDKWSGQFLSPYSGFLPRTLRARFFIHNSGMRMTRM